ncbi:MAG: S8 family serine peptidase [PVC group bacterium]
MKVKSIFFGLVPLIGTLLIAEASAKNLSALTPDEGEKEPSCLPGVVEVVVTKGLADVLQREPGMNGYDVKSAFGQDPYLASILRKYRIKEIRHLCPDFTFNIIRRQLTQPQLREAEEKRKRITPEQKVRMREVKDRLRRTFRMSFPESIPLEDLINELRERSPLFEYVGPVPIYRDCEFPNTLPNDTYIDENQDDEWDSYPYARGLIDIEAAEGWKIFYQNLPGDAQPVVVAVVDTGVDYTHPDLQGQIWINEDEIAGNLLDDDGNGYVDDVYGPFEAMDYTYHGTFIAGIIAAKGNNGEGIIGVAPEAKIMALNRTMESKKEDVAIIYAANNGAKVINCSWRGTSFDSGLYQAIEYAVLPDDPDSSDYNPEKEECIVVFAAGNDYQDVKLYFPNNCDRVISVGNGFYVGIPGKELYKKFSSSNYGMIDLLATGVIILSLYSHDTSENPTALEPIDEAGLYGQGSGTSFSAPYVSGVAALLCALRPDLNNEQVRQVLRCSAEDLSYKNELSGFTYEPGFDDASGYGKLNASKALEFLLNHPDIPALTIEFGPKKLFPDDYFVDQIEINQDFSIMVKGLGSQFLAQDLILDCGLGLNPETWDPLFYKVTTDNRAICPFSTDRPDGLYTVRARLAVPGETDKYFEVRKRFSVNKTGIWIPFSGESYGLKSKVTIKGRISGSTLDHYEIWAGIGEDPDSYQKMLEGKAALPNEYDTIGEMDLGSLNLSGDGVVTLKLVASYNGYINEEKRSININSNIIDGWPQKPDQITGGEFNDKTIFDLNQDSAKEIIFPFHCHKNSSYKPWAPGYSKQNPKLFVYDAWGNLVDQYFSESSKSLKNCPIVDVDKDGKKDALVCYTSGSSPPGDKIKVDALVGLNLDSVTEVQENSFPPSETPSKSIMIFDVNQDVSDEIILCARHETGEGNKLLILSSQGDWLGEFIPQHPIIHTGGVFTYVEKGKKIAGLYVVTKESDNLKQKQFYLETVKVDGDKFLPFWQKELFESDSALKSLGTGKVISGDLDADKCDEIIIDCKQDGSSDYGLKVYRYDGSELFSNDPRELDKDTSTSTASLADLNGDDVPELISFYDKGLTIVGGWGNLIEKVAYSEMMGDMLADGSGESVVGDYDDDGCPDIITAGEEGVGQNEKYWVRRFFKKESQWYTETLLASDGECFEDPVLADINNDGKTEIVVTGKYCQEGTYFCEPHTPVNIYVLKTEGDPERIEWSMWRFNNQKTARYEKNHAPSITKINDITIYEGDKLEFKVSASDPDYDPLVFSGSNLPPGASVDSKGWFKWAPSYRQAGVYSKIMITVSDGKAFSSFTFSITVKITVGGCSKVKPALEAGGWKPSNKLRPLPDKKLLLKELPRELPDNPFPPRPGPDPVPNHFPGRTPMYP